MTNPKYHYIQKQQDTFFIGIIFAINLGCISTLILGIIAKFGLSLVGIQNKEND